jgi:hypothetical protein
MHSVFAQDLRLKGEDCCADIMNPYLPVILFGAVCPVCRTETEGNSAMNATGCKCEGVKWRLNLTVTTEDLPPYASSISQVRTRALQAIAAAAAVRRTGKLYREIMADLIEDFGRKAVDDAVAASETVPEVDVAGTGTGAGTGNESEARAEGCARGVPGTETGAGAGAVEAATSVVGKLAPATRWHCGQRPLNVPNLRRASLDPQGFDRHGNAEWEGGCPKCYDRFKINTDTLRATCRCEGVTWRMNVAIITHDFPPHPWHPETIRKRALQSLYSRNHWNGTKESTKFLMDLQDEFEKSALYYSIIEV